MDEDVELHLVYMDGATEVMLLPAGAGFTVTPSLLVAGTMNIERDKLRRWSIGPPHNHHLELVLDEPRAGKKK